MKKALAALGFWSVLLAATIIFPTVAQVPQFPQNLPANTVVGRTGVTAGPAQAISFSQMLPLVVGAIQPGSLTNNMLANMPANTFKCNPTGVSGAPQDCPTASTTLAGLCNIDGVTFAATIAGIQSAINTASCHDIYIPAGTYSGTAALNIARSNIRLRGQGGITSPQGISNGATASTILSFTCFTNGASAVVVGDANPALTYGGIDLSDFEILLPSACNMQGLEIRSSTPDNGNMIRRVRVTEVTGNTVGSAIKLDQLVYSWRFEDVIVDHFFNGYQFVGQNHFTQIVGGQIRNNQVGINLQNNLGSSNIVIANVDIEGNTAYAIDNFSATMAIRDNFIDNGFSTTTRAIRLGAGTGATEGVIIEGNFFNNGGTAQYAIELAANGFYGLNIIGNHFNSYATANVLNNAAAANAKKGSFFGNDQFGAIPETSSWQGFSIVDNAVNVNFTVATLPTCNFQMQGARYFVTDQAASPTWKTAAVGGGSVGVSVICNGAAWYVD